MVYLHSPCPCPTCFVLSPFWFGCCFSWASYTGNEMIQTHTQQFFQSIWHLVCAKRNVWKPHKKGLWAVPFCVWQCVSVRSWTRLTCVATLSITSSATFLRSSLVGEVNQYGWALRSPGAKRMDVGVVVEGGEGEGVSCQQPLGVRWGRDVWWGRGVRWGRDWGGGGGEGGQLSTATGGKVGEGWWGGRGVRVGVGWGERRSAVNSHCG